MKILYLVHQFYPEYSSGTEKFVLNLAKMMQQWGHKVKVLTYSFRPPSFYEYGMGGIAIKEFVYDSVPVLAFRYLTVPEDVHFGFSSDELSKVAGDLIRREKPDLVHVGHSMRVGELLKSVKQLDIPYVITLTDFFMICPKFTLIRSNGSLCGGPESSLACTRYCPELLTNNIPKRLAAAREFLSGAKVIAVPSRFVAQTFQKEFGDLNFELIRHGLSVETLTCNVRRYQRGDVLVFCYAGSLNPHKGVHVLIEAFMAVTSPAVSLRIYGRGASEEYEENLRRSARPDGRIEFCGEYTANQLGEILQRIDVAIVPSLWYETYSFVANEALASHVPVITSDIGAMTETVKDNFNGFTFRMGDSRNLTETLQKIADCAEILNPLKDNINQMIFPTVEQEAYAYERIYNDVRISV
jgi:glycosyltransferase involved in cell wall biosynthesis